MKKIKTNAAKSGNTVSKKANAAKTASQVTNPANNRKEVKNDESVREQRNIEARRAQLDKAMQTILHLQCEASSAWTKMTEHSEYYKGEHATPYASEWNQMFQSQKYFDDDNTLGERYRYVYSTCDRQPIHEILMIKHSLDVCQEELSSLYRWLGTCKTELLGQSKNADKLPY